MLEWLKLRLRALFRKNEVEKELDEELRAHLEREIEQNLKEGMSPQEARYAALRNFGGMEQTKELCRDALGVRVIVQVWQDLRYGARLLLKNPAFTFIAITTLALGIGANTAIISVVNAVLINPLPYPGGDRLMTLYASHMMAPGMLHTHTITPADFVAWRAQQQSFSEMFAFTGAYARLTATKEPAYIAGITATARIFETLGVKPILGRGFLPEEERPGRSNVVVISHAFWQNRLDRNPNVVGKTLRINDADHTVIGVLPPDFRFIYEVDAFYPYELKPNERDNGLAVIGRLNAGFTQQQARIETKLIAERLQQADPRRGDDQRLGADLVLLGKLTGEDHRRVLLLLFLATSFVLLIACANLANLLSARASVRHREIAIRASLGAGRMRLVFQLLTESLLLAVLGGIAGILIAWWSINWLVSLAPPDLSRVKEIGIDAWVLGFTLLSVIVTGVIFGLVPAWQASKPNLTQSLKDGTGLITGQRGRRRLINLRDLLIVVEVGFAVMLLAGAGLLINSLIRLMRVNPGFVSEKVLVLDVPLSDNYGTKERRIDFYQRMIERLGAIPGVESVGTINMLPFGEMLMRKDLLIEGRPELPENERPWASPVIVSTNYFQVMQIPILRGRGFTQHDARDASSLGVLLNTDGLLGGFTQHDARDASSVVVISESVARRYFADGNPIGQRIRFDFDRDPNGKPVWLEIVGMTGDVKQQELSAEAFPIIYRPLLGGSFVIRSSLAASSLIASVRNAVRAIDPELPIYKANTMDEMISETTKGQRFSTFLLSIFAALAVGLSAVGIYGVTSYAVTRRTREIGIRMALGAQHSDMLILVIRQGMLPVITGIAFGLSAAVALTQLMKGLLFEVSGTDPLTFSMTTLLLTFVALLSCWIPARRVTKVDPMIALRCD